MKTKPLHLPAIIMMLCGWLPNDATAQGSIEHYYYMGKEQQLTLVPVASYQTSKNWYFEGRYNYEAINSFAMYAGKKFEKNAAFSYSVTPTIGVVAGDFNGGSLCIKIEAAYKKMSLSVQPQYTFSTDDKTNNFTYSWSDVAYSACSWLNAGISIQHTKLYYEEANWEKGAFVKFSFKNWSLPVYSFNPGSDNGYFIIGLTCGWNNNKLVATSKKPKAILPL